MNRFIKLTDPSSRFICGLTLVISWALGLFVFLLGSRWLSAVHRDTLTTEQLHDLNIPDAWDTVLIEHGNASEWRLGTVSDHPIGFGLTVGVFVILLVVIDRIKRRFKKLKTNERFKT